MPEVKILASRAFSVYPGKEYNSTMCIFSGILSELEMSVFHDYLFILFSSLQHTETLNVVFLTYFRILKKAQKSPLLPAVLEGLAK